MSCASSLICPHAMIGWPSSTTLLEGEVLGLDAELLTLAETTGFYTGSDLMKL